MLLDIVHIISEPVGTIVVISQMKRAMNEFVEFVAWCYGRAENQEQDCDNRVKITYSNGLACVFHGWNVPHILGIPYSCQQYVQH